MGQRVGWLRAAPQCIILGCAPALSVVDPGPGCLCRCNVSHRLVLEQYGSGTLATHH